MRKILILGAGRSASSLIHYLITHADQQEWRVTVADKDPVNALAMVKEGPEVARGIGLDASDAAARGQAIEGHDLIISMLPAFMHMDVLRDCLRLGKHVITPSYVPDALWGMDEDFKAKGLIVLNEMGLDPGIDHMSAMRILDRVKAQGGRIEAFESYCGGLVAPESDDNPWGYKFSWNPRNVILAGQGGSAKYIHGGEVKYIPYQRLFRDTVRINVPGMGDFDGYANRDSLKYRKAYGLEDIPTLLRGTLRKAGYCSAWDSFVQLGCTDDGFVMELGTDPTYSDFLSAFVPNAPGMDLRHRTAEALGRSVDSDEMQKLAWLGLFDALPIGSQGLTPAGTLQRLLEEKWKLGADDKDLVVMWHRFRYVEEASVQEIQASLAVVGQDQRHTAMARTVGLPIAMACKLVLNGMIEDRGVILPLKPTIYDPVLDELEKHGIAFLEEEVNP